MEIIEQKISDFFERFAVQQQTGIENVKVVIQLLDNSTTNLTPTYSAHTPNIDKYMLINEIINLSMVDKLAISYTTINNKIGKFFEQKAKQLGVPVSTLKGYIIIKNGKIKAFLFLDGKLNSEFSINDFLK